MSQIPSLSLNPAPMPVPGGTSRRPRAVVTLNKQPLDGVLRLNISNNAHYDSDTFSIELSLADQPAGTRWADFSTITDAEISCGIGFLDDRGALTNVVTYIVGQVDRVLVVQPGNTILLTGRDFAAKLLDSQIDEKFPDMTASDIATLLAQRHGLTPVVTQTQVRVGAYYTGYSRSSHSLSEWDLLTQLAGFEGFEVFVRGDSLYFRPPLADPTGPTYTVTWAAGTWVAGTWAAGAATGVRMPVQHLELTRELTLARDIIVGVKSHDASTGRPLTVTVPFARPAPPQDLKPGPQYYEFNLPNATRQQALDLANRKLAELSQHEKIIRLQLPGDNLLGFDQPLRLTGTGTAWDQIYYPDRIDRSLDVTEGYIMQVVAKNHGIAPGSASPAG